MKFRDLLTTVRGLRVSFPTGVGTVRSVDLRANSCMVLVDQGCSYYVNVDRISACFVSDGTDCINIDIDELSPIVN